MLRSRSDSVRLHKIGKKNACPNSVTDILQEYFGSMGPPWGTLGLHLGCKSLNVFLTEWSRSVRAQFQLWKFLDTYKTFHIGVAQLSIKY